MWRVIIVAILVCAIPIPALEQGSHRHTRRTAPDDPTWAELDSSMAKMHQTMASVSSSGNCDADFVRLMLPHHQAAIDMAKTELKHGNDPQMRRLAQEIITDQQSEIELMNHWLREHHSNLPSAGQSKPGVRQEP